PSPSILDECSRPGGRGATFSVDGCSRRSAEALVHQSSFPSYLRPDCNRTLLLPTRGIAATLPSAFRLECHTRHAPGGGSSVRTAARALGMTLFLAEYSPHQYTDSFTLINRARTDALFVGESPAGYADRGLIVDFATRAQLPSTFPIGRQ